jgi:uncharacterized protein involved in exopolysaccharide biosynthesis
MQMLPSTVQTDSRKLVEDLYDFLATIVRGWRLIAVCVGITLALAVIYLARVKPVYLASARLLVLQHGGQPLTVANGASSHDNLFQSVDGYSNSLTTHIMIIRSPLIVGRSLAAAGLKDVSAGSVIAGLSVKLPDPAARVLELSYRAGSRDEAFRAPRSQSAEFLGNRLKASAPRELGEESCVFAWSKISLWLDLSRSR